MLRSLPSTLALLPCERAIAEIARSVRDYYLFAGT